MFRLCPATLVSALLLAGWPLSGAVAAPVARPAANVSAAVPAMPPVTLDEAAALRHGGYVWRDADNGARLSVVVSVPDQRAYVYRGRTLVAATTVSTGREGHETPLGEFAVLQKDADHRSSLYDDAAMPFMQRLTWDGVAIHAGANPGFPASHGCVRVPAGFARKLFAATRIGTRVAVVDTSIDGAPVDLAPPAPPIDPVASVAETADANAVQFASLARSR